MICVRKVKDDLSSVFCNSRLLVHSCPNLVKENKVDNLVGISPLLQPEVRSSERIKI